MTSELFTKDAIIVAIYWRYLQSYLVKMPWLLLRTEDIFRGIISKDAMIVGI